MVKRPRLWKRLLLAALLAALLLWIGDSSALVGPRAGAETRLLAHRGVHQPVVANGPIAADACAARMIAPVEHGFIENTLPSMRAAFEHGADVVELDVHLTPDGGGFSSGVDTEQQLAAAPQGFDGSVWTNRIERIGPLLSRRRDIAGR